MLITGAEGFLGWHLATAVRAERTWDIGMVGRRVISDPEAFAAAVHGADAVVHAAGVNRGSDEELEFVNRDLAARLCAACDSAETKPQIIFANSTQARMNSPYGRGKSAANALLVEWAEREQVPYLNLVLPNLFGEMGRPNYNSVVATFCHRLAIGETPEIIEDRELEFLHAQRASDLIIAAIDAEASGELFADGELCTVTELRTRLCTMASLYSRDVIPDLSEPLALDLFNTLRSYYFPGRYPSALRTNTDSRGALVEIVKSNGPGQIFFSSTVPGVVRGNHFHRRKIERFVVIQGTAAIRLRRVHREEVFEFRVDGSSPTYVDIPTLFTHSITNCGGAELLTMFWSNEIFDPDHPDTHADPV